MIRHSYLLCSWSVVGLCSSQDNIDLLNKENAKVRRNLMMMLLCQKKMCFIFNFYDRMMGERPSFESKISYLYVLVRLSSKCDRPCSQKINQSFFKFKKFKHISTSRHITIITVRTLHPPPQHLNKSTTTIRQCITSFWHVSWHALPITLTMG